MEPNHSFRTKIVTSSIENYNNNQSHNKVAFYSRPFQPSSSILQKNKKRKNKKAKNHKESPINIEDILVKNQNSKKSKEKLFYSKKLIPRLGLELINIGKTIAVKMSEINSEGQKKKPSDQNAFNNRNKLQV